MSVHVFDHKSFPRESLLYTSDDHISHPTWEIGFS